MKILEVPFYFGMGFWIFIVLFLNLINIIINMVISFNTVKSIDNIIFNNTKLNLLEKLFNSEYTGILLDNQIEVEEYNSDANCKPKENNDSKIDILVDDEFAERSIEMVV